MLFFLVIADSFNWIRGRESWHCSPALYLPGDNPFRCLGLALMSPSLLAGLLPGFSLVSSATPCDEFLCPAHLAWLSPPEPSPWYRCLCWIRAQSGTPLLAAIWLVIKLGVGWGPSLPSYPGCHAVNSPRSDHISLLAHIQCKGG